MILVTTRPLEIGKVIRENIMSPGPEIIYNHPIIPIRIATREEYLNQPGVTNPVSKNDPLWKYYYEIITD